MDAVLSLPPPVDDMMVMPSKGTTGQCFTFCLTSSGRFVGYDFPKGYCIRNYDLSYPIWRDDSHESKLYFMECQNIKKKLKQHLKFTTFSLLIVMKLLLILMIQQLQRVMA